MRLRVNTETFRQHKPTLNNIRTQTNQFSCAQSVTQQVEQSTGGWYSPSSSTMLDEVSAIPKDDTRRTNNPSFNIKRGSRTALPAHRCDHTKISLNIGKKELIYMRQAQMAGSCNQPRVQWSINADVVGTLTNLLGVGSGSLTDLNTFLGNLPSYGTDAEHHGFDWTALYSRYDEAVNSYLPNDVFLAETLAQPAIFIDTLRALLSPRKALASFVSLARKEFGDSIRSRSFSSVIRKLTKRAANANLFYSFGVKPAVQDVQGILSAHSAVNSAIRALVANRGAFVPVRVRELYAESADTSLLPSSPTYFDLYLLRGQLKAEAAVGCQARIRYDVAPSDAWKAYLQYFGIGKVVQLGWELVPFSFVVDWVLNIQERINKLTRFGIGSPYGELRNFCCSNKQEVSTQILLGPGAVPVYGAYIPGGYIPMGDITTTRYVRTLSLPRTLDHFSLSGLGMFHLGIGSSLLAQKKL